VPKKVPREYRVKEEYRSKLKRNKNEAFYYPPSLDTTIRSGILQKIGWRCNSCGIMPQRRKVSVSNIAFLKSSSIS
jgi:hypothetical protein